MDDYNENEEELGYQHQSQSQIPERLQNLSRNGYNRMPNRTWNRPRNSRTSGSNLNKGNNMPTSENNGQNQQQVNNSQQGNNNQQVNNQDSKEQKNNQVPQVDNHNNQGSKDGDVGARNLAKSLASKGRNLWNNRKKKQNKNDKKTEDNSNNRENNNDNNDNNHGDDKNDSSSGDFGLKISRRLKIKIIIYSAIIGFILLLFLIFLAAIFGIDVSQSLPSFSPSTYNTSEFQSVYEEGSDEYKKEIKYYEKLTKASKEYEKEHDEPLKTNYIHSFLIYIYYILDAKEVNESGKDGINYSKMTDMVDKIVELMKPSDDKKNIDYEVDGEFYNNLKESEEFKDYYEKLLVEKTADEILKDIFELASFLDDAVAVDDTVLSNETQVLTTQSGNNTSNNNNSNTTITVNDYLSQSIYANANTLTNSEVVKAYTIAYSTNLVAENKKLTVNSNVASGSNELCSVTLGCSYDKDGKLVNGGGEQSSKNTYYYNGEHYYKLPLSSNDTTNLNSSISNVFGNVLVNSDGTYPTLDLSVLDGFGDGDGDYKTILKNAYGDLKYKNVGENSYVLDGSYGDKKVKTEVIFYDQKDYSKNTFCGLKKYTIGGSGCGVTSMAIVASTYANDRKYDPIYMNNEAKKKGACGTSGTSQSFFCSEAKTLKYKCTSGTKYNKTLLNSVLKHLSQGHLVVVRVGSGHFTGGGHYMVLGGIDPATKKVYVYDPNNRSNSGYRKSGNGWYSFNDIIVKEAYNFYIIWKG